MFLEILTIYHFGFLMYLHISVQTLHGIKLLKKILTEISNKNDQQFFSTLEFNWFFRESAIVSILLFFVISRYKNSRHQLGYWVVPVSLLSLNALQILETPLSSQPRKTDFSKSVSYR